MYTCKAKSRGPFITLNNLSFLIASHQAFYHVIHLGFMQNTFIITHGFILYSLFFLLVSGVGVDHAVVGRVKVCEVGHVVGGVCFVRGMAGQ